ncbi:NHL repeat-containing protein [Methanosphaerula palustris]|uniref:hypothetical protein n=1 Tax=Methanosphaerula palustris TaxID=475088 RepID=UPI00018485B0|nr:hypothetical protein [Methanosphaerula palustris]
MRSQYIFCVLLLLFWSSVQIVSADGENEYTTQWGSPGQGDGQFNGPNSITVDSTGKVYVVDRNNTWIQRFDANGTFISK